MSVQTFIERFLFKKKLKKIKIKLLIRFYQNVFFLRKELFFYSSDGNTVPDTEFMWTKPHRQLNFNLVHFSAQSHINLSTGTLVKKAVMRPKFFKRWKGNTATILLLLWYFFRHYFEEPLFLYIKNYSFATQYFLWQFLLIAHLELAGVCICKAHNPIIKTRRRIKKTVLKSLKKY